jgi:type IV pilus assembly protein PilC
MDLCIHLELYENAGLSLRLSLQEFVKCTENKRLREVMGDVLHHIEGGLLFSEAIAKHPLVFDSVFVGLIEVGEKTGRLSFILKLLCEHQKWVDEIKTQTLKALRYPIVLISFAFLLITLLMTFLVPELIPFIKNQSDTLPFSSRLLFLSSEFISNHLTILFSIPFFLWGFFTLIFKIHPSGKRGQENLISQIPFIGSLQQKFAITRFCHTLFLLFESGVDILRCLQIAQKSLPSGRLLEIERSINAGLSLSQAFEKTRYFPSLVIHMIRLGEETGHLSSSLSHVKDVLDTSLKRQIEGAISLIEPSIIMVVGLVLGWVVLSIFHPLYSTLTLME